MSTLTLSDYRNPRALLLLGAFLLVVIGIGAAIGISTAPDAWYAGLEKPPFNPPNWVFGPVWFTLYLLIAIAGWRSFLVAPSGLAMKLWVAQMLLNWIWSPVFFLGQALWPAGVIIVAILATILAFIATTWQTDRTSALLFVPYAAWVAFATLLNLSLAVLN
jgi:benzodiazapine receptor